MATKSSRHNPEEQQEKMKNRLEPPKSLLENYKKKGNDKGSFKHSKRGSFIQ